MVIIIPEHISDDNLEDFIKRCRFHLKYQEFKDLPKC